MIDGHPQTHDEMFEAAGYHSVSGPEPTSCDEHPQGAVMRYSDGVDRCTTNGHIVSPKVRDVEDRVAEALQRQVNRRD